MALFENLVCVMMLYIKLQAESQLSEQIGQTVIDRPTSFQDLGGDDVNVQAQGILERAAFRVGFRDAVSRFEPAAAGLDSEAILDEERQALVTDIGSGTTDCSLLLTDPQWWKRANRQQSLLGHSGCHIGGNGLDIALTFRHLMPLLSTGDETGKGTVLPILPRWNAMTISDVPTQSDFYNTTDGRLFNDLLCSAQDADKVALLLRVWCQCLSCRLVRSAKEGKITLFSIASAEAVLSLIQDGLVVAIVQQGLEAALDQPLTRIVGQVQLALDGNRTALDVIYLTGSSACSSLIEEVLTAQLPGIPLAGSDGFGLVTAGLTHWAQVVFH